MCEIVPLLCAVNSLFKGLPPTPSGLNQNGFPHGCCEKKELLGLLKDSSKSKLCSVDANNSFRRAKTDYLRIGDDQRRVACWVGNNE